MHCFKNSLSEKDVMPMFICTSGMVAQIPIYVPIPENACSMARLHDIEKMLKTVVDMFHSQTDRSKLVKTSPGKTGDPENLAQP